MRSTHLTLAGLVCFGRSIAKPVPPPENGPFDDNTDMNASLGVPQVLPWDFDPTTTSSVTTAEEPMVTSSRSRGNIATDVDWGANFEAGGSPIVTLDTPSDTPGLSAVVSTDTSVITDTVVLPVMTDTETMMLPVITASETAPPPAITNTDTAIVHIITDRETVILPVITTTETAPPGITETNTVTPSVVTSTALLPIVTDTDTPIPQVTTDTETPLAPVITETNTLLVSTDVLVATPVTPTFTPNSASGTIYTTETVSTTGTTAEGAYDGEGEPLHLPTSTDYQDHGGISRTRTESTRLIEVTGLADHYGSPHSAVSQTVSTFQSTSVYIVTECPPYAQNCRVGHVTTEVRSIFTAVPCTESAQPTQGPKLSYTFKAYKGETCSEREVVYVKAPCSCKGGVTYIPKKCIGGSCNGLVIYKPGVCTDRNAEKVTYTAEPCFGNECDEGSVTFKPEDSQPSYIDSSSGGSESNGAGSGSEVASEDYSYEPISSPDNSGFDTHDSGSSSASTKSGTGNDRDASGSSSGSTGSGSGSGSGSYDNYNGTTGTHGSTSNPSNYDNSSGSGSSNPDHGSSPSSSSYSTGNYTRTRTRGSQSGPTAISSSRPGEYGSESTPAANSGLSSGDYGFPSDAGNYLPPAIRITTAVLGLLYLLA